MQYVIFTKVCQSHSPGHFVEMRKEDTTCSDCGGTDLAVTVRLAIPLSLYEIPVPINENIRIYVAFLADKLSNSAEKHEDFSPTITRRMYDLYRKLLQGKASKEYEMWFGRCRKYAQVSGKNTEIFEEI
uniref:Uncharacterized protein n=1 Tax=Caenorhabditis japonica TaxID=281687 RepID=A0A8R1IKJ4_CAEJA